MDLWTGISAGRRAAILASDAPHLQYLIERIGEAEIAGPGHNPLIIAMARQSGVTWYAKDETAWCAVAVNGAVVAVGGVSTQSALARSFVGTGTLLRHPVPGAIFVIPRGSNPLYGHTGIVESVRDGIMTVVNGNVGDMVKRSRVRADSIVPGGLVWPAGIPLSADAREAVNAGSSQSVERDVLRFGDRGRDVEELQKALTKLGFKPQLRGSGYYGGNTRTAVYHFQVSAGLLRDGVAGPITRAAVAAALAAAEPKAAKERAAVPAAIGGSSAGAVGTAVISGAVAAASGAADAAERLSAMGTVAAVAFFLVITALAGFFIWRKVRGARVAP